MDPRKELNLSVPDDSDARSLLSMQELEPSPVEDEPPDLETGEYFPKRDAADSPAQGGLAGKFSSLKLGLSGHQWDHWCMFLILTLLL